MFVHKGSNDFITKVKQTNSQSDLISMLSFAGPSYLTVRSSVCIILIWDPCVCNLNNLCQTESSCIRRKLHQQCALNFNEQIVRAYFLLLQPSIRPVPTQVILLCQNIASNVTLYPCESSRQNHLGERSLSPKPTTGSRHNYLSAEKKLKLYWLPL